ncbi:MAG: ABC transporter permease [Candidatus Thorarchaeota archaeon]
MFESQTKRRKKKLLKKKYKRAEEVSGSQLSISFRRFRKNRAGLIGLLFVVLLIIMAFFADFIAPYDPEEQFLLNYPGYSPGYQAPGVKEGGLFEDLYANRLLDPSFELNLGWILNGWNKVNLTEQGILGGVGTFAAGSNLGNGELSQDISTNEDFYYMELNFRVYLDGPDQTTLSVVFRYDDDMEDQIDLLIEPSPSGWTFVRLDLHEDYGLSVRNPEEVVLIKDTGGSDVLVDDFFLSGGEYFQFTHIMGTNFHSEDLFTRLIYGSRVSLLISFGAIFISLIIGLPLGLLAGYYRGRVDEIIMRATDVFLTLPFYFVLILAIVVIQNTQWVDNLLRELGVTTEVIVIAVMFGLGIFGWMGITRLVRASIFQVRETDYVEAARALGASDRRIMIIHILPNVLAPLIVVVTLNMSANILVEAGLAFLGFTSEDLSSWGRELNNGFLIASVSWWSVIFPALFIILAVMSFNLLGDGLRDAFDPRLR